MSNPLAIATVTAVLQARIRALVNDSSISVTAGHPRNDPSPGVYLTLYHMTPNPALRNQDLPTRRSDGTTGQRPVLALNLRYLFSFVADSTSLEAERLAGIVLTDLYARPLLSPDEIGAFLTPLTVPAFLRASDLARQTERIKLTPVPLDSEELARIWGLFNQNLYALSMVWEVSVVLLEGQVEPSVAFPVATTGLVVRPVSPPTLSRLYEEASRQPVVTATDTMVLEGSGLLGDRTRVFVGEASAEVTAANLVDGALRVPLSAFVGLLPGVHPVIVEHRVIVPGAAGDGLRPAGTSNALAVMVRPTLGAMSSSVISGTQRNVRVAVTPLPTADQSAELLLESGAARRSSHTFVIDGANVVFEVANLPAGTWQVRVSVDGAGSLPTMSGGVYTGPTLVVP